MRLKRYAIYLLVMLIIISAFPVIAAAENETSESNIKSGSLSAKKYSKAEICQLLDKKWPRYSYAELYEEQPSYRASHRAGIVKNVYLNAATDRLNIIRGNCIGCDR